jgi:hypothetical protein
MGWRTQKSIGWVIIAFAILCWIFGVLMIMSRDRDFITAFMIAFPSSFVGLAFYNWGKYGEKQEKTRERMRSQVEDLLSTTGLPKKEVDTMVEQASKLIDNGAPINGAVDTVLALHNKKDF